MTLLSRQEIFGKTTKSFFRRAVPWTTGVATVTGAEDGTTLTKAREEKKKKQQIQL